MDLASIKEKVISLYQPNDQEYEKYERIISNMDQSLIFYENNNELLKVAILLWPCNKVGSSFSYNDIQNILHNNNVEIINNELVNDCIVLDQMNPKSLLELAKDMVVRGIPLINRNLPFIKSKDRMNGICHRDKKYRSFMEYLYHIGLFLGDGIKTNNPYILSQSSIYYNKIVELILLYGNGEHINFQILEEWANTF